MNFSPLYKNLYLTLFGILGFSFLSSWNPSIAQENQELPKAQKVPIKHFAALPDTTGIRISPNGKWLRMTKTIKGKLTLIVQELNDPKNYHVIPPTDALELNWSNWVSDEHLLISYVFEGSLSNEWGTFAFEANRTSLLSFNVNTGELKNIIKPNKRKGTRKQLTKEYMPQIQDRVVDILRKEPYHILVAIDGDQDGGAELRKIDIRDGSFDIIYGNKRGVQNWDIDQFGNIRFASGYDRFKRRRFYFDPITKKSTDYNFSPAHKKGMTPFAYTNDLDVVIMDHKRDNKPDRFITYNMKTDKVEKVLYEHDKHAALGIKYAPLINENTNGTPIAIYTSADKDNIVLFDDEWAKLYEVVNKALPKTNNNIVSSTSDKSVLIISSVSVQDPGVYYMWNRPKKQFFELALVNKDINPDQMSPMTAISYKARDGLNIPAYLSIPLNTESKNLPLVVMPHGGPHARDYLGYDFFTQFLTNRGYAVLQPNFRGSANYTENFKKAGERQWGLKMQDDVTDGVKYLIDQGIAAPNRICIIGGSYGGYAALMGAVKTPDLYQCAASINGVTHLKDLINYDKTFIGGNVWTKSISNKDTPDDQLRKTSPALQAEMIKIPILLIQFKDDKRVPRRQAYLMRDALKKAKKTFTYREFNKGGHSMRTSQSRIEVFKELEKFLDKHLN